MPPTKKAAAQAADPEPVEEDAPVPVEDEEEAEPLEEPSVEAVPEPEKAPEPVKAAGYVLTETTGWELEKDEV